MLRILVVDPYPIVCEGVKQILQTGMSVPVAAQWADAEHAVEVARVEGCDLVLFEIPSDGVKTLLKLRSEQPGVPVLVFTTQPECEYAIQALSAGAAGYLSKDSSPAELVSAIRRVCRGGKYLSPGLAEALAVGLQPRMEEPAKDVLSTREYQTLVRLASGKTVGEIASELNLSVKTVSTYRTRTLDKLHLRNNVTLTRYAIKQGLI